MQYTQQQVLELIRCSEDAIYFIEKYIFKTELYPFQREFLKSLDQQLPVIGAYDRQMGKTLMMKGFLLWKIMFKSQQTVMMIGRESWNTMHMAHIHELHAGLPKFLQTKVIRKNRRELYLESGSSIRCGSVSSASVRGMTINHLWFDECQLYSDREVEELFMSVVPMLCTGNRVTCVGTGDETLKMLKYLPSAVVHRRPATPESVLSMTRTAVTRGRNG